MTNITLDATKASHTERLNELDALLEDIGNLDEVPAHVKSKYLGSPSGKHNKIMVDDPEKKRPINRVSPEKGFLGKQSMKIGREDTPESLQMANQANSA